MPRDSNRSNRGRGGRGRGSSNRICYNCGKRGHLASQCWAPQQPIEVQRERERQLRQAAQQRREQRAPQRIAQHQN